MSNFKAPKTQISPKGIAAWPKLDVPDVKYKAEQGGEYTIDLVLPADEAQPMIDMITATRDEFYKESLVTEKKKVLKKADLTCFKPQLDDDGNETGKFIFKFKAKGAYKSKKNGELVPVGPIPRFDSKGKPIKDEVWSGSEVKIAYETNCWYTAALGVGISLRLKAVQVIELRTKGGARDAKGYGFGEEDGYVAETPAAPDIDATGTAPQSVDASGDF